MCTNLLISRIKKGIPEVNHQVLLSDGDITIGLNSKVIKINISLIFCRYNGKYELYCIKTSIFLKNKAIFTFMAVKKVFNDYC